MMTQIQPDHLKNRGSGPAHNDNVYYLGTGNSFTLCDI